MDCERETYHDAGTDSNHTTAVSVGNDVTVADGQKCHDDHPHRVEHALVLTVVVAARAQSPQKPLCAHAHVSLSFAQVFRPDTHRAANAVKTSPYLSDRGCRINPRRTQQTLPVLKLMATCSVCAPHDTVQFTLYSIASVYLDLTVFWWRRLRRGVAVERRIRDREVAGSGLGRALRRKNSGQVSHTYG